MMMDKELLRMVMEHNPGQSPAFVLEQYKKYLQGLNDIHPAIDTESVEPAVVLEAEPVEQGSVAPVKTPKDSLTCGYTKRNLKIKPADAIQKDKIYCCICGKECQTLTERHLNTHNGLTREGYIKLCGYPKDQALISINHLARMKDNVLKAQAARKKKKVLLES